MADPPQKLSNWQDVLGKYYKKFNNFLQIGVKTKHHHLTEHVAGL
jgi:hypothetical protein